MSTNANDTELFSDKIPSDYFYSIISVENKQYTNVSVRNSDSNKWFDATNDKLKCYFSLMILITLNTVMLSSIGVKLLGKQCLASA